MTKTIAKEWGAFGVRANTVAFGLIHTRCVCLLLSPLFISNQFNVFLHLSSLTAAKEAGASIEIDGKKVALGVPGAQLPASTTQAAERYSHIPLRRGGTPEDAAASVLL